MTAESPAPARPAPPGDRRARRKAETRQRLLDAATRLFAKQGFEATRPQDIAREADLAIGTFYLHFADRRDAFLAFTDRAADELLEYARRQVGETGRFEDRLRSWLEAILDYMDENPGVVGAAFANEALIGADPGGRREASLRDRLAASLARGIDAGMARGEFRDDYDAQLVSYAVVGLIQQALLHHAQLRIGRDEVLDQVTRFCARALVSPRASSPDDRKEST